MSEKQLAVPDRVKSVSRMIDPVKRKFKIKRIGAPDELKEALKDTDLWTDALPYHFFAMAGITQVGKTSIANRMLEAFGNRKAKKTFHDDEEPTVGGKFLYDIGPFGLEEDLISICDTAGAVYTDWHVRKDDKGKYLRELKYIAPNARMGRMIYRRQMRKTMGAKQCAIFIVYDANDRATFDGHPDTVTGVNVNGVDMFYRWAKYRQGADALIALVANKSDLDSTEVTEAEGQAKVAEWNALHGDGQCCHFFTTSAKSNTGIKEMTIAMADLLTLRDEDHKSKSVYPFQADRMALIEEGYFPKDVEHVLLDEEGCVEKTVELFHNLDDMEDRIGLW
jgi:GTPase SAR1 family protein